MDEEARKEHFLRITKMLCGSVESFLGATNPGRSAFVLIVHDTDGSQLLSAHSNVDDETAMDLMRECITQFLQTGINSKETH